MADAILGLRDGPRLLRAAAQLMKMPPSFQGVRIGLDIAAMATVEGDREWRDPSAKRTAVE